MMQWTRARRAGTPQPHETVKRYEYDTLTSVTTFSAYASLVLTVSIQNMPRRIIVCVVRCLQGAAHLHREGARLSDRPEHQEEMAAVEHDGRQRVLLLRQHAQLLPHHLRRERQGAYVTQRRLWSCTDSAEAISCTLYMYVHVVKGTYYALMSVYMCIQYGHGQLKKGCLRPRFEGMSILTEKPSWLLVCMFDILYLYLILLCNLQ